MGHRPMAPPRGNEPYSFHSGGANFLFTDGHIQFVRDSVNLTALAALCTRAGGEVAVDDY
jgi:prepilin-type processing-associated H-X9-DG protein